MVSAVGHFFFNDHVLILYLLAIQYRPCSAFFPFVSFSFLRFPSGVRLRIRYQVKSFRLPSGKISKRVVSYWYEKQNAYFVYSRMFNSGWSYFL